MIIARCKRDGLNMDIGGSTVSSIYHYEYYPPQDQYFKKYSTSSQKEFGSAYLNRISKPFPDLLQLCANKTYIRSETWENPAKGEPNRYILCDPTTHYLYAYKQLWDEPLTYNPFTGSTIDPTQHLLWTDSKYYNIASIPSMSVATLRWLANWISGTYMVQIKDAHTIPFIVYKELCEFHTNNATPSFKKPLFRGIRMNALNFEYMAPLYKVYDDSSNMDKSFEGHFIKPVSMTWSKEIGENFAKNAGLFGNSLGGVVLELTRLDKSQVLCDLTSLKYEEKELLDLVGANVTSIEREAEVILLPGRYHFRISWISPHLISTKNREGIQQLCAIFKANTNKRIDPKTNKPVVYVGRFKYDYQEFRLYSKEYILESRSMPDPDSSSHRIEFSIYVQSGYVLPYNYLNAELKSPVIHKLEDSFIKKYTVILPFKNGQDQDAWTSIGLRFKDLVHLEPVLLSESILDSINNKESIESMEQRFGVSLQSPQDLASYFGSCFSLHNLQYGKEAQFFDTPVCVFLLTQLRKQILRNRSRDPKPSKIWLDPFYSIFQSYHSIMHEVFLKRWVELNLKPLEVITSENGHVLSWSGLNWVSLFDKTISSPTRPPSKVFSPSSLWSSFQLIQDAASGQTKSELQYVFPPLETLPSLNIPTIHTSHHVLLLDSRFKYRPEFLDKHPKVHFSQSATISKPDLARHINQTVRQETKGAIQELVDNSTFEDTPALILLHTLYFKGRWMYPFDPKNNLTNQPFNAHLPNPKIARVDYMCLSNVEAFYSNTNDYEHMELDYEVPKGVRFGAILPRLGTSFNLASLKDIDTKSLFPQTLHQLWLPRFKLESVLGNELLDKLQILGVEQLFKAGNLNNMVQSKDEKSETLPLNLSKLIHKVVFEVNEEGTVGSAATLASFKVGASPGTYKHLEYNFIATRTFLFYVRDIATNSFLVMGVFSGQ